MNVAGVDRAILVPPSIDKDRNDYVIEAAQKHPDRFAIMGRVPLRGGGGRNLLAGWKDQPGMLGVRLTFHRDADRPWIDNGTADWFWGEAEDNHIPVMVHAPERLTVVGEIAARHPRLRIIVDHMGFARATMDDETIAGADRMIALSRYPNVCVKVSALPCFSVPEFARTAAPRDRGVRAATRLLGQRHHSRAGVMQLPADGDACHRGARFPLNRRPRMDHGARDRGMFGMAVMSINWTRVSRWHDRPFIGWCHPPRKRTTH
jgi:hypothetical protein